MSAYNRFPLSGSNVVGMQAAMESPALSHEEAQELFSRYQDGDEEALRTLVVGNLRLAGYMAALFLRAGERVGVPREDLFSKAYTIMLERAPHFDPDRGLAFGTWMALQLRLRIHNFLRRGPKKEAERRVSARAAASEMGCSSTGNRRWVSSLHPSMHPEAGPDGFGCFPAPDELPDDLQAEARADLERLLEHAEPLLTAEQSAMLRERAKGTTWDDVAEQYGWSRREVQRRVGKAMEILEDVCRSAH